MITLISLLLRRWIYREAQIRDQAVHDPLTGLANRRELFRLLAHELARGRRSGLPMAICIMDLDHFKRINDQYGHGAGDRVLVKMAETLNARLRESDLVGRIGVKNLCWSCRRRMPTVRPMCWSGAGRHCIDKGDTG